MHGNKQKAGQALTFDLKAPSRSLGPHVAFSGSQLRQLPLPQEKAQKASPTRVPQD